MLGSPLEVVGVPEKTVEAHRREEGQREEEVGERPA
jgi:hypothetical protein